MTKVNDEAERAGYRGECGALAEFFLILSIHFHYEEKGDLERVIQRELPVHTQEFDRATIIYEKDTIHTETIRT